MGIPFNTQDARTQSKSTIGTTLEFQEVMIGIVMGRNYAWYQIDNPAGFTIDWKLKTYEPVDSSGVVAASSPGIRNVALCDSEFVAILPNATEEVVGYQL